MAAEMTVPTITQDDLVAFHSATFGSVPPEHSLPQSEDPSNESHLSQELNDELGFYPDGRKRTLTDEQIAMFRSSEVYSILRKRELAREQRDFEQEQEQELAEDPSTTPTYQIKKKVVEAGGADTFASQKPTFVRKRNKKQKLGSQSRNLPKKEDEVPSRRIIRELDDIQVEEQVLDY